MEISKEQGHLIKGIAILLIMIHNYVDILLGIGSNEMVYSAKTTQVFIDHVFTADALWYILSFAGWMGVPLFFFLSGYGLTKKYGTDRPLRPASYIKSHVIKLWKLLLPIYLVYFAIYTTNAKSAIAQATFTINILSYGKNGFYLDPGVYWFFGAILQFYLLFIVLRKLSTRWLWILAGGFVAFHYLILYAVDSNTMTWMRHNFTGWGATFILGMIAARSRHEISRGHDIVVCAASLIALCVCMVTKWLLPFTELCIIIFLVTFTRLFTARWLCFVGIISPSIFVLHPLIRQLFYSIFSFGPDYPFTMTAAFTVTTLLLSWVHHEILQRTGKLFPSPTSNL